MKEWQIRLVGGACICLCVLLGFGVRSWLSRQKELKKFNQERAWIHATMRELDGQRSPSAELIAAAAASTGAWDKRPYLIFSNGWAGYQSECGHNPDGPNDANVLKGPGGAFYLSAAHLCTGVRGSSIPGEERNLSPLDLNDFLERRAKNQAWYPFSPDGKRSCIIRVYPERRKTKKRVLIAITDKAGQTTTFDQRFTELPQRIHWSARWPTEDSVLVRLFTYIGGNPMTAGRELTPEPVLDLTFQRDQQTGRFLQVTNAAALVGE